MEPDLTPQAVQRYADGEMTAAEAAAFTRRLSEEPELARQVAHQQQLRQMVQASASDRYPGAPQDLRNQLTQLAQTTTDAQTATSTHSNASGDAGGVIGRVGSVSRWAPAAVAAVLLIGAAVMFFAANDNNRSTSTLASSSAGDILPASQVEMFGKRHTACAQMLSQLHTDPALPKNLQALPESIAERFQASRTPVLDLSSLGYTFDRVGQCTIPGEDAVHLIYKTLPGTGHTDHLSLWVVSDHGQLSKLAAGTVYTCGKNKAHPVIVWRKGGLIYYLTGDSLQTTERAAKHLKNAI